MVFSSLVFQFYFLPVVLLLYFLAPRKGKNVILFVASLIFYAWGEPVYLFLMLFSILANYLFGLAIAGTKPAPTAAGCVSGGGSAAADNGCKNNRARLWLILACVLNLAMLGFFKYADFLIENLNGLLGLRLASLDLPLPLGISFYTFQAMSYIIDLYRGKVQVQRSFIAFGTYVALFPQLIAGPIVRFQTIAEELTSRRESLSLFSQGALRFTAGLAKKVLLANGAGAIYSQVTAAAGTAAATAAGSGGFAGLSVLSAWIGILAYTFQIYFDFSGYSDMAVGLGRMFGFHFPENFQYPYISQSITEFWRRWHMTLSSWFREYVYIPLGGSRNGTLKQIRSIAVVWALTGIWHGASWNFLIWGAYFGVFLIAEKLFLLRILERTPALLRRAYAMFFVIVSWVIFSAADLSGVFDYLSAMFALGGGPLIDDPGLYLLENNLLFFAILLIGSTPLPRRLYLSVLARLRTPVSGASGLSSKTALPVSAALLQTAAMAALLLLVTACLVSSSYNPFLYFRF